jgi:hypothetical protein
MLFVSIKKKIIEDALAIGLSAIITSPFDILKKAIV